MQRLDEVADEVRGEAEKALPVKVTKGHLLYVGGCETQTVVVCRRKLLRMR